MLSTSCRHEHATTDGITRTCRGCGATWVDGPLTRPNCVDRCPYGFCTPAEPCRECCRCTGACLIHND